MARATARKRKMGTIKRRKAMSSELKTDQRVLKIKGPRERGAVKTKTRRKRRKR